MATATEVNLNTQDDVLAALSAGQIDTVAAAKRLAELRPKATVGKITVKVRKKGQMYENSQGKTEGKGNVLVYGLQRMPISLYPQQWQRLLAEAVVKEILDAIEDNRNVLDWK